MLSSRIKVREFTNHLKQRDVCFFQVRKFLSLIPRAQFIRTWVTAISIPVAAYSCLWWISEFYFVKGLNVAILSFLFMSFNLSFIHFTLMSFMIMNNRVVNSTRCLNHMVGSSLIERRCASF